MRSSCGVVVVPVTIIATMDQGVRGQEAGARHRRRPVRGRQARAASARPATRNAAPMSWTKCGLNGPVSDAPGTLVVPDRTGEQASPAR